MALVALFLLHNDLWLWSDRSTLLGLPVGLTYHLGYCLAAMVLMAALVRWLWPAQLEADETSRGPGGSPGSENRRPADRGSEGRTASGNRP